MEAEEVKTGISIGTFGSIVLLTASILLNIIDIHKVKYLYSVQEGLFLLLFLSSLLLLLSSALYIFQGLGANPRKRIKQFSDYYYFLGFQLFLLV